MERCDKNPRDFCNCYKFARPQSRTGLNLRYRSNRTCRMNVSLLSISRQRETPKVLQLADFSRRGLSALRSSSLTARSQLFACLSSLRFFETVERKRERKDRAGWRKCDKGRRERDMARTEHTDFYEPLAKRKSIKEESGLSPLPPLL